MIGEEIFYALNLHITGESITYTQYRKYCTYPDHVVRRIGKARLERWKNQ